VTPTAHRYDVVSPWLSVVAATTISDSPIPADGTRPVPPAGDSRPTSVIGAAFTHDDAISVDGIETDPEPGSVVEVNGVTPDDYPVTVSDVFRITNESDGSIGFSLSTTADDIELGMMPPSCNDPGRTTGLSARIRPDSPSDPHRPMTLPISRDRVGSNAPQSPRLVFQPIGSASDRTGLGVRSAGRSEGHRCLPSTDSRE
jgi:hypothetical protein